MDSKDRLFAVDVLIVGAGPAGATAALNLAMTHRVALIDSQLQPRQSIGQSLPPSVRRLLTDMDLWELFQAEGHSPCYGNRSIWGSPHEVLETDFLHDPDGHGWHIDRARFDLWLREIAVARGALLMAPAQLHLIDWDGDRWRTRVQAMNSLVELTASVVIDAGGRAAPVARSLGARRKREDRLVCSWLRGKTRSTHRGAGFTYIEAAEDGWWYTAPTCGDGRVLAFHTDFDLPAARLFADPRNLLQRAAASPEMAAILGGSNFTLEQSGFCAAHSAQLQAMAGHAWFAVGDAACSFDPLSSQGLLNAFYTGLVAAEATDRYLSGMSDGLSYYLGTLNHVYATYQQNLSYWYSAETRWRDKPFWQRRQSPSRLYGRPRGTTAELT